jgi:hypothetical protein
MRARIPQDVDLEDRLVFGLSPIRFGYLVVAALLAFTTWSAAWASPPVRAGASIPLFAIGAGLAWGRWRGRNLDGWVADLAVYIQRNSLNMSFGKQRTVRQAALADKK